MNNPSRILIYDACERLHGILYSGLRVALDYPLERCHKGFYPTLNGHADWDSVDAMVYALHAQYPTAEVICIPQRDRYTKSVS